MEMSHFEEAYEYYQGQEDFTPRKDTFKKRVKTVYPILEEHARQQEVITYGELADQANTDERRYLSLVLGAITRMEHREGHPPLSALVVLAKARIPSNGFFDLMEELNIAGKYDANTDEELFEEIKRDVYAFWRTES
jgi:hypothetical protein